MNQFPFERSNEEYGKAYAQIAGHAPFPGVKPVRIAVLASHTANYFSRMLSVRLWENGIPSEVWTGPYGQVRRQAMDKSVETIAFKPDFVLVIQSLSDVLGEESDLELAHKEQWAEMKAKAVNECRTLVKGLHEHTGATVLLTNFITPVHTLFGSIEKKHKGLRTFVQELNLELADELRENNSALVVDLDSASSAAGKISVAHEKYRYLGDVQLSFRESAMLAEEVLGAVIALTGRTKKCIVLDLDNTLWGGVVGEDGFAGIRLGPESALGKAFTEFQRELLRLHKRGIILAINSRNNPEDALDVMRRHPGMILKEEHFAAIRINWQDKATNLSELASELNIGLDSMVFIDDDSFNTELVKQRFPQVTCIHLPPDPSSYPLLIRSLRLFDTPSLTTEDLRRGALYFQDRLRRENQASYENIQDFLDSLQLEMTVAKADAFTIPRVSQLSLRTNQFNMTLKRYSEREIAEFSESEDHGVYWMSAKDRFGDYGVVGACVTVRSGHAADIDSFFVSCRVLGKGIETSFIWKVLQDLSSQTVDRVTAHTTPTNKNVPFLDFYERAGFTRTGENSFELAFNSFRPEYPRHVHWSKSSL